MNSDNVVKLTVVEPEDDAPDVAAALREVADHVAEHGAEEGIVVTIDANNAITTHNLGGYDIIRSIGLLTVALHQLNQINIEPMCD